MITKTIGCCNKKTKEKEKDGGETKLATAVLSHSATALVCMERTGQGFKDVPFQESTLYGSKP